MVFISFQKNTTDWIVHTAPLLNMLTENGSVLASVFSPRGFYNQNRARKIQPHSILELPESLHRKKQACRLLLACATYVLTHSLITEWLTWSRAAFCCSGEHLLCSLISTHQIACLTSLKPGWNILRKVAVNASADLLCEGNWFACLLSCLFLLACRLMHGHPCRDVFLSTPTQADVFLLEFHAYITLASVLRTFGSQQSFSSCSNQLNLYVVITVNVYDCFASVFKHTAVQCTKLLIRLIISFKDKMIST